MVCFLPVRFGVLLTFRALALRRSSPLGCVDQSPRSNFGISDGNLSR